MPRKRITPTDQEIDLLNAMDNARHAILTYLHTYKSEGYGMYEENSRLRDASHDLNYYLKQFDTSALHQ